ncbi:MAG: formylglycine-generating enzyme family protein [Verrucomicrobia bacterium]|nr:formylglycine-generating enzyme family protein [Verrucomicrobiota bacterium]
MNPLLRARWAALAALPLILSAAEPALDPNFTILRQVTDTGSYGIAVRIVDQHLQRYPDDPRLHALRARLEQLIAESKDDPARLPPRLGGPAPIPGHEPVAGAGFTVATAGIAMLWVAPGEFLMADPVGSDDDTEVVLTRGYWLGRTEVTQEQWRAVMENLPSPSFFKGSDRPVENIAWNIAMEFCRKVNDRERAAGRLPPGYEYTLPTEAQWEYACRAGTTGPHAGNLPEMAWYEPNGGNQTHPVAQKKPNAWGFYDMHGNVWEWCLDGYNGYPGGRVADPMNGYEGPSAAMARILRGGSFGSTAGQLYSGARYRSVLSFTGPGTGLRLALTPVRK